MNMMLKEIFCRNGLLVEIRLGRIVAALATVAWIIYSFFYDQNTGAWERISQIIFLGLLIFWAIGIEWIYHDTSTLLEYSNDASYNAGSRNGALYKSEYDAYLKFLNWANAKKPNFRKFLFASVWAIIVGYLLVLLGKIVSVFSVLLILAYAVFLAGSAYRSIAFVYFLSRVSKIDVVNNLGQFTRNYTQTTKRGLLTTNKG